MSRPIDADAVKGLIRSGISVDTYADQDYVCELVDDIPTIDAVNVVHGEWIKRHGTINCSVCKRSNWSACFEDTVMSFNFCPNCGARMKGADDE